MAFHQPTAPPQRQSLAIERRSQSSKPQLHPLSQPIDDSQEWVLFSPTQAQTESYMSTERTPRTTGVSRLSDFGSWNTGHRSIQEEAVEDDDEDDDNDEADELDSLDEGLHAFREPNADRRFDQSGGSILPGHDGLGGFPASSPPIQEQLFNFELYNKHRKHSYGHNRTTSSIQRQLNVLEDEAEDLGHLDKTRRERIEKWRLDSSRIISEELEKEARSKDRKAARMGDTTFGNVSELSSLIEGQIKDSERRNGTNPISKDDESLWQRITRRVVEDLIGVDDTTLSIILGQTLLDEDDVFSKTPTQGTKFPNEDLSTSESKEGWQNFLINRLAKELGMLARYLSGPTSPHETLPSSSTMDYAGIPIASQSTYQQSTRNDGSAHFQPTIRNRHISVSRSGQPRPIMEETIDESQATPIAEIEYWERVPDLRAVFNYLSQRFMSRRYSSSAPTTSNIATTHTEDSLNRTAIIQKHHPLVSRARANAERRGRRSSFRLSSQLSSRSVAMSPSLKRAGTSCASWSTKRHKVGASDHGSRNYWDIGGSIGSENAALGGVWGEV